MLLFCIAALGLVAWSNYKNPTTINEYTLSEVQEGIYGVYVVATSNIPAENYEMVTININGNFYTVKGSVNIHNDNGGPRAVWKNTNMVNGDTIDLYVPEGSFQPETWDFNYGKKFDTKDWFEVLRHLSNPHVAGLSILGGDPLEPENIQTVTELCKAAKKLEPDKSIWLWTGYDFLDFIDHELMTYLDVVVDGRFEEDKKDLTLWYRGSWNQRVIDVPKSIKCRCAIRLEGDWR